jgi:hypothetical protein
VQIKFFLNASKYRVSDKIIGEVGRDETVVRIDVLMIVLYNKIFYWTNLESKKSQKKYYNVLDSFSPPELPHYRSDQQ